MKRTIKNYEGRYKIDLQGRIYSFWGNKWKERKEYVNTQGYKVCLLSLNGKNKNFQIHRLIYQTFKGFIPADKQINHKDGNKLNNKLDNLELVTQLENTRHAWRIGLVKKVFGENCYASKLKQKQVNKIKKMSSCGYTQKEIAEKFKTHQTNIHYILSGKTWNKIC